MVNSGEEAEYAIAEPMGLAGGIVRLVSVESESS